MADVAAHGPSPPYGEVRWNSGTLPTDYTFTGQRDDALAGLHRMGARWYDPYLSRWVSADTIVPDPADPQDLNRFSYVRGNPLRYTDPTGYLTQDQIMSYLQVSTWEEVLSLFGPGGSLEGRWGWLETLRQAELGDEIGFYDGPQHTWPPSGPAALHGTLVDREGTLHLLSGDDLIAASEAPWMGNVYYIARSLGRNPRSPYFGPIYADRMYMHLEFDTSRVNPYDAVLDGVGIVTEFVPSPVAKLIGAGADTLSVWKSAWALHDARVYGAPKDVRIDLWVDFGLDVGSYTPGVGFLFDVGSLARNLWQNTRIYYGP